jgi:hypothetical protein
LTEDKKRKRHADESTDAENMTNVKVDREKIEKKERKAKKDKK